MTEISTDVDHLIRTIADRKKIQLNELRDICRIDKKNLDKWVAVLEDEGYIEVEYGIRGTYVIWKGDEPEPVYNEYSAPLIQDTPKQEFASELPMEESSELPQKESEIVKDNGENEKTLFFDDSDEDFVLPDGSDVPDDEEGATDLDGSEKEPEEESIEIQKEPEELLNQYLETKRSSDFKHKILNKFENEDPIPFKPPTPPKKEEVVEKPIQRIRNSEVQALVSSFMEEVSREKAKITSLNREKENLMDESLSKIEGKIQSDIVAITEKIIDRQKRITQLKEQVLELPDKIEEVQRIQNRLDELKTETSNALTRTKDKAENFLSNVEKSKDNLKDKIDNLKTLIEDQTAKTDELESNSLSLEDKTAKINESIEDAKRELESLTSRISGLSKDLEQVLHNKSEIEEIKDSIKDTVASHSEELDSLEEELEGIEKVEQWVSEYISDYESKIIDIENYIEQSDADISELRESAESLYLQKYIKELERVTAIHEQGLEEVQEKEKDIDIRISESKDRIAELLRESKEMMKKLQEDSDDDYEAVLEKVRGRLGKAKNVVSSKTSERVVKKIESRSNKTKKKGKKK